MSLSVETLAVARKYTDDSLAGAGAVAGVPCKIQSITAITGGNRVTFLWTDNNGDDHTSAMDVMNGVDGEDGKGIQSVSVNAQNHLIITYTDGTTVDAGQIEIHSSVDSVNGQTGAVVLDAEDVGALPDNTPIPSKTSDLTNDSGFATTSDVSTALADYTKTADLTTLLAAKQDTLTFDDVPTENSNNPVKSGGVFTSEQDIYEVMSEMGAKNLFRVMNASQVINGIEWVVNDDGTITANGTATEESKFTAQSKSAATHYYDENMMKAIAGKTIRYSGCPSGGSSSTYLFRLYIANAGGSTDEYGEGAERTIISDFPERNFSVECIIKSGQTVTNLTYKPMICLASNTNTTYQPYSKTNKQITDDTASAVANVPNGAINLAKPSLTGTTTVSNVEFVIDSEGKVTANGTASANIRFDMAEVTLKAGRTYQLCEPSSLQARRPLNPEGCRCYARIKSSGVWVLQNNGWRNSYTPSSDVVVSVGIAMQSGNEVTDEIFAPMLVLDGTDVGDTFYPYAKTNRELTEKIDIVGNLFTTTTKVVDNITHGIATTVATLGNLPIGTYVVSGQFNSESAMSGGGLVQFASSGVIQNGASCNPIINQGFKANAGLTGIFNVTNATNQINLQIYTATADLTVSSARLAAIRIA